MPASNAIPDSPDPAEALPPLPDDRFFNRELSWLEFNQRVLDHAADSQQPLLERGKFLAITSSNLDEFFMVRVGGLKLQSIQNSGIRDPSGLSVNEQLAAISDRCHGMQREQYRILSEDLFPAWEEHGIHRVDLSAARPRHQESANSVFQDLSATLSPHALDPSRPLPLLQGLQLHLCVRLAALDGDDSPWQYAFIPLGRTMPRIISLPSDRGYHFTMLEDLISHYVEDLFPGREVLETVAFRITRNADIRLREEDSPDLMVGMEEVLESRKESAAVRLELAAHASEHVKAFLTETFEIRSEDLFITNGPVDLTCLFQLIGIEGFDDLKDEPWRGQRSPNIDPAEPMFDTIAKGDILLVHPYERFDPVVRLVEEAAVDPDVLAIKQVLYRTSRDSPIVAALMRAAERGKYVTAIVELKARFDEARNMEWAREMEHAGVQVIYGIKGLKTHAKICIIVRSEPHGIVRYVHFGTGNYNEVTMRLYSDVSLLTCNEELGSDATTFFNAVTGASYPLKYHKIAAAPTSLRSRIRELITSEIDRKKEGQKAAITVKVNSLVDPAIIDALYRASQAGVKIRLNVRGICCLRPGVKGLSDNITVISILDRYLEHARIMHFEHGGDDQVLISSADWMPRNLDRRIELLVPVESPPLRKRLIRVLQTYFKDNTNSWKLTAKGEWKRSRSKSGSQVQAQRVLYERAVHAVSEADRNRRTAFETHAPPE
ncbi:Polyphosphate kinase [Roseimaritima multifibrata]|uniref:Polyphosphate kinase n=1 Tax=Roseimaritima multifibrata TaxID=1930274 RepID=A0A517MLZ1_9BACT|nr:polyphosphate kinase 1 [Roseimaritima multifibrata]QDS95777.1 Polyphosphate kinase [Roseimaritima multifibrata]